MLRNIEVEYVVLKGWLKPIGQCRSFNDLPPAVSTSAGILFPYLYANLIISVVSTSNILKGFLISQSNTLA
jgi:hypothetical protein